MASQLEFIRPLLRFLPEIKAPAIPPSFGERAMWTLLALALFFIMYNVVAVGVDPRVAHQSDFLQIVTASKTGSLITTGIGPIVLASIFLQLFAGAKIINVNLRDPDEKSLFYGTQKLLALALCLFEAYVFVVMGHLPVVPLFGGEGTVTAVIDAGHATVQTVGGQILTVAMDNPSVGGIYAPYTRLLVVLQIALGSIILLFLDEIVTKHGIGSGISLFIAAGVSMNIVGGALLILFGDGGVMQVLSSGGAEVIGRALLVLTPLLFTVLVFLLIVYVEGVRIDIPLAFDRARGMGSSFPIKLTYISNIPVILAFALVANLQFMAAALAGTPDSAGVPMAPHLCLTGTQVPYGDPTYDKYHACRDGDKEGLDLVSVVGRADGGGVTGVAPHFVDGALFMLTPVYKPLGNDVGSYLASFTQDKSPVFSIPRWVQAGVNTVFMVLVCILFGMFWVETTGMDAKSVAGQLDSAGLQIPGYRRDPRIIGSLLEKYIPPVVIIGSAFVGLLASVANLTGALGSGTGILLTVGIVYKMYQDIEKQNIFENNALARQIMGK